MSHSIIFTDSYEKRAKKFFKHHPDLINIYHKILLLLKTNPFHPSLRLHQLQGKLKSLYSISLTLQYRITLEFLIKNNEIILVDIGAHDQVY